MLFMVLLVPLRYFGRYFPLSERGMLGGIPIHVPQDLLPEQPAPSMVARSVPYICFSVNVACWDSS